MLGCDKTITLIRHNKSVNSDSYTCRTIEGVSWFGKCSVAVSDAGAKPVNSYVVRIPEKCVGDVVPQTGDFVVLGTVESIDKPSQLRGREYFAVTAVGDNRRGNMPHWVVRGQ